MIYTPSPRRRRDEMNPIPRDDESFGIESLLGPIKALKGTADQSASGDGAGGSSDVSAPEGGLSREIGVNTLEPKAGVTMDLKDVSAADESGGGQTVPSADQRNQGPEIPPSLLSSVNAAKAEQAGAGQPTASGDRVTANTSDGTADGRVIVDQLEAGRGNLFRQGPKANDRPNMTADQALAMFRRMVVKDKMTKEDFAKAASLVGWIEGVLATDREAYNKLPPELQTLYRDANKELLGQFTMAMPNAGNANTTSMPRQEWDARVARSIAHARRSALNTVLGTTFAKGIADTVPQLAGGLNILLNNEDLKKFEERTREWNKSTFGVPKEYQGMESLFWAEFAGNVAGTILLGQATGGAVKLLGPGKSVAQAAGGGERLSEAASTATAAPKNVTPEMIRKAMDQAVGIVDKLRQAAPKIATITEMGVTSAVTGGDVEHRLKENDLSDSQSRAGGAAAMALSATGPAILVKLVGSPFFAEIAKKVGLDSAKIQQPLSWILRRRFVSGVTGSLISESAEKASDPNHR